jgi:hypothetical protein
MEKVGGRIRTRDAQQTVNTEHAVNVSRTQNNMLKKMASSTTFRCKVLRWVYISWTVWYCMDY